MTSAPASKILLAALRYAAMGWRVFPLNGKKPYAKTHGHKDATTDRKQIKRWWHRWPAANVGIACDSARGPVVIDIDGESGARAIARLGLPSTREAMSRRGRRHLYFAPMTNGTAIRRTIRPLGERYSFDILGDGGYVVAPPSIHPETGKPYKWLERTKPAPFPAEAAVLVTRATKPLVVPDVISEGERDSVFTSLAGSMRRRGMSEEAILAALRTENDERTTTPLPDHQLVKIAHSIGRKEPAAVSSKGRTVAVRLSRVKHRPVEWLIQDFLPLGKFALIEGDPGQGKSTLTLHIAAQITRGRSVLGTRLAEPRNVILVTYEDGLADTVRPRINALRGNPRRIIVFRGVVDGSDDNIERQPTLPDDIERLKALVEKHKAALVIIDPLGAALSEGTDSHKDASVRRVVAQMARLAEDTHACVLGVRHLTKAAATNAVRAGGGSIAFVGAARVALLVAEHPDDSGKDEHERRRVLATVKNNLSRKPKSKLFSLRQRDGHEHAVVRWEGESDLTADDLNATHARENTEDRRAVGERDRWLAEFLGSGPKKARDVVRAGKQVGGWNESQLRRSLERLGGRSERKGFGKDSAYWWSLLTISNDGAGE